MTMKRTTHVKRVILTLLVFLMFATPLMAASTGTRYLSVAKGAESDYFQFDEKGVYVPQTDEPVELKAGWIILSGQEPVTITGRNTTIVLQKESILTIGSTKVDSPSYYLVAGSASFLMERTFSGTLEVSTPVGIYKLTGPGEMFVSSDFAELVFSLGGQIQVINTITRQLSEVPPYTYLNLADPFLNTKEISRQTYETLSINPDRSPARMLPSAKVEDGITFKAPASLFPVAEVEKAPVVEQPKKEDPPVVEPKPVPAKVVETPPAVGEKPEPKAPVVEAPMVEPEPKAPVIATTLPEAPIVRPESPMVEEAVEQIPVVEEPKVEPAVADKTPESFDVYIVHTNDVMGNLAGDGIGYARLATLVDWGRSVSDRNLLLDAGNTVSGTPMVDALSGEPVGVLLDMLGYNSIAPGPADYAFGVDRLKEASRLASSFSRLDVLASNILDSEGNMLFDPYEVYDLDGYRVGVIGVSVPAEPVEGIEYLNDAIVENAQALVDEVSQQADFVIVLGNIGDRAGITSSDIAQSITGIDLIIDGEGANAPAQGKRVGDTLIVNATGSLSSIGLVAMDVTGVHVDSLQALRIGVEDVDDPKSSALASLYGIENVPPDEDVQRYIESQEARYAAMTMPSEPKTPAIEITEPVVEKETVVEAVEPPVETEEAVVETKSVEDPLAIKEPLGIVASTEATPADVFDWGVVTSFNLSRDGFTGSSTPKMGLSINPFYHRNAFKIGMQAFFLTDGELFSPSTYDVSVLRNVGGIVGTTSSIMRFIDYIEYGEKDYPFHLRIDGETPIDFGNRVIVDGMGVASGPYEEHLGLYSSVDFGKFGLELFADDLYLSNWLESKAQLGGGRLTFAASPSITLGLSSLATVDRSRNINAYPAFDFTWRIRNERRLQLDLFTSLATKVSVNPFDFTTVYDGSGSGISSTLPNFLVAGGLDLKTLKWNARLVGAVQNHDDPLVALGAFNQTTYSGQRMLDANAGIHYVIGAEAGYTGERFGVSTSWYVPVDGDLSRIIPINGTSTTGDRFAIEASYGNAAFEGAIGFRRVGMLTGINKLFTSGSITSGVIEMIRSSFEGLERNSQPYLSLRYRSGLFGLFGDISLVPSDPTNVGGNYTPRLNLGASVTIGTSALEQGEDPSVAGTLVSGVESFDASISTSYTRSFVSSGSDLHHLTIKPTVGYSTGEAFSIGIGPKIAVDFTDISLYSHDDSPFGFGSDYPSTIGKVYDGFTDIVSLIDHVTIGADDAVFQLALSDDLSYSMGPLATHVDANFDSILDDRLALQIGIDTKALDVDAFLNDLSEPQFGGIRFGIAPFASYDGVIGVSSLGTLELTNAEKQLVLLPGLDFALPISKGEKLSIDAVGSFTTMLGYKVGTGFKQNLFDSSASAFLDKFDNYLVSAGLDLASEHFSIGFDVAMHSGALSYGMFNPLFLREQSTLSTALDVATPATTARRFTMGTELNWKKDMFGINATYLLPFSSSFSPDVDKDLFTVRGTLDLSWFDIELAYAKKGFLGDLDTITSKSFFFDTDSALSAGIAVRQGPLTFRANISSLATFTNPAGSWNQLVVDQVSPALTVGVDIDLF